jgi:hypothetical protein
MRDITFEAAFLRDAILVGLLHERHVPEWATQLLSADLGFAGPLAEVLSAPMQLSPIRDALQTFGQTARPLDVTTALLACAALDPTHRRLGGVHLLRVLSDIRRLAGCPPDWANAIEDFETRAMLAAAGLQPSAPTAREVLNWLNDARPPVHFLVSFGDRHEAAAFAAALSRAVAIDADGRGTSTLAGVGTHGWTIGLDDVAWVVAHERFSPLPTASLVPYPGPVSGFTLTDDTARQGLSAQAMETRLGALALE